MTPLPTISLDNDSRNYNAGGSRLPRERKEESGPASVSRVPTRFVRKYTLRVRPETSGAHGVVADRTGHVRDLGDCGLGNTQLEEATDFVLLAVEP